MAVGRLLLDLRPELRQEQRVQVVAGGNAKVCRGAARVETARVGKQHSAARRMLALGSSMRRPASVGTMPAPERTSKGRRRVAQLFERRAHRRLVHAQADGGFRHAAFGQHGMQDPYQDGGLSCRKGSGLSYRWCIACHMLAVWRRGRGPFYPRAQAKLQDTFGMNPRPIRFIRRGQIVTLAMYHPTAPCWRCCARTWAAPAPRRAAAKATAAPAPWCWARHATGCRLPRRQQLHPPGPFASTAWRCGRWKTSPAPTAQRAASGAGGHGAVPRLAVRLLHARLCDEPVRHVPEPSVCQGEAITRDAGSEDLSGNLCRCTGYRPILDAAQPWTCPRVPSTKPRWASKLELLRKTIPRRKRRFRRDSPTWPRAACPSCWRARPPPRGPTGGRLHRRGPVGDQAAPQFAQVLDVTRVAELRRVERYPHHIAIGAAVTLTDAFAALVAARPQLADLCPPLCRPAGAQLRARWAAMWPTARPLATPCRC
jgi:hypothetical protein